MFRWTDEMIRFMADAARQTDFHRRLAALLRPWLEPEHEICDAGCGLGFLSLALAPYVRSVTAVERDARALAVLEQELAARHVENVHPRCADIFADRPPRRYDDMVFCFFGSMDEILTVAGAQCRGRVVAVKRDHADHRFTVTKQPLGGVHGTEAACRRLASLGIPYRMERAALAFDQPFRSLSDARRFFELYRRRDDAALITDDFLRERLTPSPDGDFPWRLQSVRQMGIFVFDASSIPDELPQEAYPEEKPAQNRQ